VSLFQALLESAHWFGVMGFGFPSPSARPLNSMMAIAVSPGWRDSVDSQNLEVWFGASVAIRLSCIRNLPLLRACGKPQTPGLPWKQNHCHSLSC
jgi:hypothetical protein